jgi:transposase
MGRSRGGLTTKIHALTDAHGLPLEFVLTPGQAGDCPVAAHLLGWLRRNTIVLADKAYDADWLRRRIEAAGAAPNIPAMVHRRWKPCFSPVLYRARNRIERFFNRIKHFRRLATRYEKHAANFLAMLKLAAAHLRGFANNSPIMSLCPRGPRTDAASDFKSSCCRLRAQYCRSNRRTRMVGTRSSGFAGNRLRWPCSEITNRAAWSECSGPNTLLAAARRRQTEPRLPNR